MPAAAGRLPDAAPGYRRIAVEEAFATPELLEDWRQFLARAKDEDPAFFSLYSGLLTSPGARNLRERLNDVGRGRIRVMDRWGVDMQVLSLTAPGVQLYPPKKGAATASEINTRLAAIVAEYPDRFAGLAAVAPQAPAQAAREIERAVTVLGLRGVLINSHTRGKYLDDRDYWPIFEAAEALGVPVYLHPNTPSPQMAEPYLDYGLAGPGWGFAAETGLHAVRLILSGLLDACPGTRIILGHMGEGLPFWLHRLDSRFDLFARADRTGRVKRLRKKPGDYIRDNFLITTSGMPWPPALMLAREVMGPDRIMFAIDYPYESSREAVRAMDEAPLSREDRTKIYSQNATRLFRLPPGPGAGQVEASA
ncbi:MAG TPA: amidohydrolase [Gammaproteobacteria bacterium]|nr:amidohydrolase [Gammaproteobacteria bacterium]